MTRFMMAVLLIGSCVLPARAEYGATVGARYVDLDTRGNRGQVQEYDGKLYYAGHGDVQVSNESANGLFDFSLMDIGSTEENGTLNVDHKSGLKASALYQNMHHRLNATRYGQLQNGAFVPKTAITIRDGAVDGELVMRRSEAEFNLGFVSPENSARWIALQYWSVDKAGSRWWMWPGNIPASTPQAGRVDIDNTKHDFTVGLGTNLGEMTALSAEAVRSEFEDNAPLKAAVVDGGTGSSNSGGVVKRADGKQSMTGAEFKFRHDVSKDLALTGAFTGRQRENLRTQYKFNAVVGALNAAYKVSEKLSLLGKLYLRAFEIDENLGYNPAPAWGNANTFVGKSGKELDKTTVRGELVANYRPIEKVHLKAAYKLEVNNRRDAPDTGVVVAYSGNRYFADGYFVPAPWHNSTAHSDTRHLLTLGAKAELPLGMELEADFKKLQANRAAFVTLPNKRDEANLGVTVPLPQHIDLSLGAGYVKEKNTIPNFNQYSQMSNTYRFGLDWSGSSKVFIGADASYETSRIFQQMYMGSGAATWAVTNSYHVQGINRHRNTTFGAHAKVNLPKGVVVMGDGSYTRSLISTPMAFRFTGAGSVAPYTEVNDWTPSSIAIARGRLAVEFTPEKLKNLTARASYAVSDWVDRFDTLNSGRASVAQLGASMKF